MGTATRTDRPIGTHLERLRLEHRARRTEQVLAELRARRRFYKDRGEVSPRALSSAIDGFAQELVEVRRRLRGR